MYGDSQAVLNGEGSPPDLTDKNRDMLVMTSFQRSLPKPHFPLPLACSAISRSSGTQTQGGDNIMLSCEVINNIITGLLQVLLEDLAIAL